MAGHISSNQVVWFFFFLFVFCLVLFFLSNWTSRKKENLQLFQKWGKSAKYLCILQELNKSLLCSESSTAIRCAIMKTNWFILTFHSWQIWPQCRKAKQDWLLLEHRVTTWSWQAVLKRLWAAVRPLKFLETWVYLKVTWQEAVFGQQKSANA